MKPRVTVVVLALVVGALLPPGAGAGDRHHRHKTAGVKGVVLNGTCPGACAEPSPPEPPYIGQVTIAVRRASDGTLVASREVSEGHFRIRVKRGQYDVNAIPPNPPECQAAPTTVCPAETQGPAIIAPCLTGET